MTTLDLEVHRTVAATTASAAGSGAAAAVDRRRVPRPLRRLLGPALLIGCWAAASGSGWLDAKTLASPWKVVQTGRKMIADGSLPEAVWVSAQRVGWGLMFGVTAGVALAVIAGLFRIGEDIVDSNLQVLRTIPVLGLLPLIIIWFGIGEEPKIIMIAFATMFPVYQNTFSAIRSVDDKLVEAGATFGLGRVGLVRHVLIPGALPGFLVGLRFSLTISWLVLVFVEQVNAQRGLGFLLNNARSFYETDKIVVVLAVYGVIGLFSDTIVRLLERSLLSWRRSFAGR